MRRIHTISFVLVAVLLSASVYAQQRLPIIDMHLHALLDIPVGIHLGERPPAAARFPGLSDAVIAKHHQQ